MFDDYSNYSFGSIDMFKYETENKAIQIIIKKLNETKKKGIEEILEVYATNCGKILGEFKFNADPFRNEDVLIEELFRVTKTIQQYGYFMNHFRGCVALSRIYQAGVVEFCKKAILLGIKYIKREKDVLI